MPAVLPADVEPEQQRGLTYGYIFDWKIKMGDPHFQMAINTASPRISIITDSVNPVLCG